MTDTTKAESTPERVVLVVEDNTRLCDLYEHWLTPVYEVRTAATGDEALDIVSPAIDIVLLDRNLPALSGDEVLERIRDRGLDCKVAMVTAIDPTTRIVDMDFDDYLVKPVTCQEVLRTVESLLDREEYADLVDRYFELTAKLGVLEMANTEAELEGDEDYQRLVEEHQHVADELSDQREALLDAGEADKLFTDVVPE